MECDKFREKYKLNFKCCEVCHLDSNNHPFPKDFLFLDNDEVYWDVCCEAERAYLVAFHKEE